MTMDRKALQTDVATAYQMLLGRGPGDVSADEHPTLTVSSLLKMIVGSPEYQKAVRERCRAALEQSTEKFIEQLALEQMAPWRICGADKSTLEDELVDITTRFPSVLLFDIRNSLVTFRKDVISKHQNEYGEIILSRAVSYQRMIEGAIAIRPLRDMTIAIDLTDGAEEHLELPIFTFQRNTDQLSPLLPDFELYDTSFLEFAPVDNVNFEQKKVHAVFAGSTTGANITLEAAMQRTPTRIRAAFAFKGREDVTFRLPNLVQCTPDAEAYLTQQGFGTGRIEWHETYGSKFIISVDGNGATCTRSHLALKSNSVFMKYDSPFCLFYSIALTPWEHFVPIHKDEDVISAVAEERAEPGRFEPIARAGRSFAGRLLTREAILAYVSTILSIYGELIE